ncbi:helix-turn-helix domain-containing protein [Arthrobacter bussei]|uniref:ATP-binding protein n=1 Tax=Arthrobacter bussei TaxID=2594179 RepID=A0A7X1NSL3_9MICC|nr:ATP-binding protein [Arthrobacter bussei]MPY12240.1 ATP-binding protein [Arthrobacter bussei]
MSDSPSEIPGSIPPFAYDGQVGEEKLVELLALGAERPDLDFKRELDLKDLGKKLDFVKDCASMMNLPRGGYLVIGANDDGTPAGAVAVPTKEMFESAALTQIVKGYVDAPVDIRAQVHQLMIEGKPATMAVIYVAPPADGLPAAMSKPGIIPHKPPGRPETKFHQGTVFTREGTTNAVVSHRTWSQVLQNFRTQVRTEARSDTDALIRRVVQTMGDRPGQSVIIPDLAMDPATFIDAVRSTLNEGNERLFKRFLLTAKNAYQNSSTAEEQSATLNRIAAVATEAVLISEPAVVEHVMNTLFELYQTHLITPDRTTGGPGAPAKWLEIILRVMAVGSAAIRAGMYEAIPTIVLRRIGDETYSYRSWIRHGLVEASRANMFVRADASGKGGNLIAFTAALLLETPELRPDIELPSGTDSPDVFLDSLCQFDFIWCCLSLAANDGSIGAAFYPSCAMYHQHRVIPALSKLEGEPETRQAVFGTIPDQEIADSIVTVIDSAEGQSWQSGGWWRGPRDLPLSGWTRKNASILER